LSPWFSGFYRVNINSRCDTISKIGALQPEASMKNNFAYTIDKRIRLIIQILKTETVFISSLVIRRSKLGG